MVLAPVMRMEHLSEKEWLPMAILPIEQALAYVAGPVVDRVAAGVS
jgi:hypothetical protein